jgi:hypothetical protein
VWLIVGATVIGLALTLLTPMLQRLLHFAPAPAHAYAVATLAAILSVGWFELLKGTKQSA